MERPFAPFSEFLFSPFHRNYWKITVPFLSPTSTMCRDEIRGFCQPCLLLQIVKPGLSHKKEHALSVQKEHARHVPFCLRKKSYCSF